MGLGQNLVRATDLGAIRRASEATLKASWLLNRSGNLPPSLPDAARREVSEALNRYVFDAKTARRTLSRERLNSGELSGVIGSYNTAINRFMDVKSKHDGALQRYWEPVTLERYQSTRATLLSVHQVFLALTEEGLVNSMYRSDEVPSVVRERMSALNGQIDQLQSEIDSLLTAIAAEPRDRFAQTTN